MAVGKDIAITGPAGFFKVGDTEQRMWPSFKDVVGYTSPCRLSADISADMLRCAVSVFCNRFLMNYDSKCCFCIATRKVYKMPLYFYSVFRCALTI